ncbi:RRNA adenine N(6)-methyltransferase [Aphelenchoides bicaudatus]|nr:RRNA adenine N(6)-methyltransferase [Aphelenchoides bicaudatus]
MAQAKKQSKEIEATGKICVLDLELQGVRNMKKLNYPAKYILIRAPSLQILQERLTARGTETPETIAQRLQHAQEDDEAAQSEPHLFDKVIVNDVLEKAHQEFVDAIGDELEGFKALRAKLANGKSNSSSTNRAISFHTALCSSTFFLVSCTNLFPTVAVLNKVILNSLSILVSGLFRKIMTVKSLRFPALPAIRDFIHMYQLKASRILSQNYIMDMNINRKFVKVSGAKPDAHVIEIGPGPGGITRAILEQSPRRLDVVEIDEQFMKPLQHLAKYADGRMHIHHANIRNTDLEALWLEANCPKSNWWEEVPNLHVVGNLPFNIASPLIIELLRLMAKRKGPWAFGRVPLTLTFQKEVAKRICAPIDCDERTRISIVSQHICETNLEFIIPGQCFVPKVEVDVGVVKFVPREQSLIPTCFEIVEKVCRHAFHYRNKPFIKPIMTLYPPSMAKEMGNEMLKECRVNPKLKCYEIGMDEFADLCVYYEKQCLRTPGLFGYNYYGEGHVTLEELAKTDKAFPPGAIPEGELKMKDGIPLSKFANVVD